MKPLLIALFTLGLLNPPSTFAATPDNHPLWKSDKLPDLYYEILVKSVEQEMKLQAPDGRFRSHLPATPEQDVRSLNMYIMEYIYAPALLYVADNPANTLRGDKKVLDMALRAGDWLASIVDETGLFVPTVNGVKTSPLDSHRTLYCWAEAYGLLESHLGDKRRAAWREALIRAGGKVADDLRERKNRPRYIAPFLGTSPNHFGLWATTVWRLGMILNKEDWVSLAQPVLYRFVREVAPGGYWAEHDGPTMTYDYLNSSVAGLYWNYSGDPAALKAMRLSTDFHTHWSTPDGVDIHTVDQRNRNHFEVEASWGLFTFCYFPEGRRFVRFKLLSALGDSADPLRSFGLEALGRIAQDAYYHTEGGEARIPQEMNAYYHRIDRPAVVKKSGPWVYSMSALVSVPSPLNQFFLDRIDPISLWHAKTKHIIGGGNSKGQPELATFMVKRANGDRDCLPLDALITGNQDTDTMCVALEGFSLRLVITTVDSATVTISASAEKTYDVPDSAFLNLPLIVSPGETIRTGSGESYSLGETEIKLEGLAALSYKNWRAELPAGARFYWPYFTYTPYGPVRVPKNIHNAVAVVSIPLTDLSGWTTVHFRIE